MWDATDVDLDCVAWNGLQGVDRGSGRPKLLDPLCVLFQAMDIAGDESPAYPKQGNVRALRL
jgi:hypothetical protein